MENIKIIIFIDNIKNINKHYITFFDKLRVKNIFYVELQNPNKTWKFSKLLYNHFIIWNQCVNDNIPYLILSNNTQLTKNILSKNYKDSLIIFNHECYKIYPEVAKKFINSLNISDKLDLIKRAKYNNIPFLVDPVVSYITYYPEYSWITYFLVLFILFLIILFVSLYIKNIISHLSYIESSEIQSGF